MRYSTFLFIIGLIILPFAAFAGAIAPNDLLVFQAGTAGIPASGSDTQLVIDEINPNLTNQTLPVQQFDISTVSSPLYTSNEASDGSLSLSDNGTLLTFSGWTSANGTAAENLVGGRGAGTLDINGNYTQPATYVGSTTAGNQTRSAYSPDGVNYYFGDKGGVYITSGTSALAGSANTRSIKGYGGSTYALMATTGSAVVSTITPTSPGAGTNSITYGPLSGLPSDANAVDFTLLSSGSNGSAFDTLYFTDNTGIIKYSLAGSTWTLDGTDSSLGTKLSGITALETGTGVDLFVTSDPSSGGGVLEEVTDTSAYNAAFSPTAAATLYTAPTGDDLRGVSIAPVPEPETWTAIFSGLPMLAAFQFRRSRKRGAPNA